MRNMTMHRPGRMSLYNDFDRMVNSFFNDSAVKTSAVPAVDVKENEESYLLEADVPGFAEKDIEIQVKENLLTLSSKVEDDKEEKNGFLLRERKTVNFKRSFILPKDVDQNSIEAHYDNGVLSLTLPKKPEVKPKTIDVKIK